LNIRKKWCYICALKTGWVKVKDGWALVKDFFCWLKLNELRGIVQRGFPERAIAFAKASLEIVH
jgi:hypothetical protein